MAEEKRCLKHDMIETMCADCRGLGAVADPYEGVVFERFFTARYAGSCALVPEHTIEPQTEVGIAVEDTDDRAKIGYACTLCVRTVLARAWSRRREES